MKETKNEKKGKKEKTEFIKKDNKIKTNKIN